MSEFLALLEKLSSKQDLNQMESGRLFQIIFNGGATPAQIASALTALRVKGESLPEITGAVQAMRSKMIKLPVAPTLHANLVDTCGTGGDKKGTFNISTAVAFVVAGCGVPVAKHGNKAISSQSGSADVLAELSVRTTLKPDQASKCLEEAGICFLLAGAYHKSLIPIAPIRKELGFKTIFNILGPLCNPANPPYQLVGVFDLKLTEIVCNVLKNLGSKKVISVHGHDGGDEISISAPSTISILENNEITSTIITPDDYGLDTFAESDLNGGSVKENAQELLKILKNTGNPAYRTSVLLNSAAALLAANKVKTIKDGIQLAENSIYNGSAYEKLQKLVELSNLYNNNPDEEEEC